MLKVTDSIHQVCAIHHPNLCTLHGSLLARYNPTSNVDSSSEGYTLTVLTDPIRTQTLQDLLSACGELRPDRAIKYLTKLLGAIERIHKDNIVHGGLRPKMIFVGGGKGEEETLVKLSGTAWYQRLVDLNKSNPWVWMAEDELPDSWICPGALEEPFVYDRPRDMYVWNFFPRLWLISPSIATGGSLVSSSHKCCSAWTSLVVMDHLQT